MLGLEDCGWSPQHSPRCKDGCVGEIGKDGVLVAGYSLHPDILVLFRSFFRYIHTIT